MVAVVDPVTLVSAGTFVLFSVYSIALGLYGFVRTGLLAFFLLIAASVIGLGVSVANVALVYDSYIGIRVLGQSAWKIFYYTFVCIQPIGSVLSAIAITILTVWITHRSNQSLEPTAGRRDDQI
jgi:cyanophycinase-like exopeptidase